MVAFLLIWKLPVVQNIQHSVDCLTHYNIFIYSERFCTNYVSIAIKYYFRRCIFKFFDTFSQFLLVSANIMLRHSQMCI